MMLEAVELGDDYAEHREGDGGAEVAEEGAFVGCEVRTVSKSSCRLAVFEKEDVVI